MNYETITLSNTNDRDIAFKGILLGHKKADEKNGRWEEYAIYKTYKGQFVAELKIRSRWVGESTVSTSKLCKHESQLFDTLGFSDTAKDLYEHVGIRHAQFIEGDIMADSQYNIDKRETEKCL
jgi:EXLDI family protein